MAGGDKVEMCDGKNFHALPLECADIFHKNVQKIAWPCHSIDTNI